MRYIIIFKFPPLQGIFVKERKKMDEEKKLEEHYYCSECGVEVKFEDAICQVCRAELNETNDEVNKDLVLLKVFKSDMEAKMASDILESDGIVTIISADNEGGMNPSLSLSQGVRLLVSGNDLEKAVTILNAMKMY
jgi:hypothetical protein